MNDNGTSFGDRPNSKRTSRADIEENDGNRGHKRGIESNRPAKMGGTYEQPETRIRRDSSYASDLQLNIFEYSDDLNIQKNMQEEAERLNKISPAFSISQETIDVVLADGGNKNNNKLRILTQFSKQLPLKENADFLKREYNKGGKGFELNGNHISVWFDEGGIKIQCGKQNDRKEYDLTWEQAAKRVGELLELGRYMPQSEIDVAPDNERQEIAESLIFLERDYKMATKTK